MRTVNLTPFGHPFAASVDGDEEVVAARFHFKYNLAGVVDDDGTDVQTVRCHGRDAETAALGHDDGAAVAQAVGRGARRCGYNQAVGLVRDEEIAVYIGADGNHGSRVALQHGDVVEGERTALDGLAVGRQFDDGVVFDVIILLEHLVERVRYLARQHVGQESQTAHVDADDGRLERAHTAGGLQERAVAAHRDDIVDAVEAFRLDNRRGPVRFEILDHPFDVGLRLLTPALVADDGKTLSLS